MGPQWDCAWPPAQVASICMWVTFGGTLSHPTATQINSMRCQPSMLTHRRSMFSSYTKGGKPTEALGLEKPPIPPPRHRPDSPLCCDKRRGAPLLLPSCLFTFRITPSSFWTMYWCVLLCFLPNRISMRVVCGPVWLTRAHGCVHTFPFNFPPCARGPRCPSPHL